MCCAHAHSTCEIKTEPFEVDKTLVYSKNGYTLMVKVRSVDLDSENVMKLKVVDASGREFTTTREHLHSPNNPDIG